MAQLFDMNQSSYEAQQEQLRRMGEVHGRKGDTLRFKFFLTNFVRLHAYLFSWSVRMHLLYLKNAGVVSSQNSTESTTLLSKLDDSLGRKLLKSSRKVDIEMLQQLTVSVLEDFDHLLQLGRLNDLHLLRLLAISIFTVHFAEMPETTLLSTDSNFSSFLQSSSVRSTQASIEPANKPDRTLIQSQALIALFGLVNRFVCSLSLLSLVT